MHGIDWNPSKVFQRGNFKRRRLKYWKKTWQMQNHHRNSGDVEESGGHGELHASCCFLGPLLDKRWLLSGTAIYYWAWCTHSCGTAKVTAAIYVLNGLFFEMIEPHRLRPPTDPHNLFPAKTSLVNQQHVFILVSSSLFICSPLNRIKRTSVPI